MITLTTVKELKPIITIIHLQTFYFTLKIFVSLFFHLQGNLFNKEFVWLQDFPLASVHTRPRNLTIFEGQPSTRSDVDFISLHIHTT